VLAAAGLIALKEMRLRLDSDHENAKRLAEGLAAIPGILIDTASVQINMVFFSHEKNASIDSEAFVEYMKGKNILVNMSDGQNRFRFVTHYWISREHIGDIVKAVEEFYR